MDGPGESIAESVAIGGLKEELIDIACEIEEQATRINATGLAKQHQMAQLLEYIRQLTVKLQELPDEKVDMDVN